MCHPLWILQKRVPYLGIGALCKQVPRQRSFKGTGMIVHVWKIHIGCGLKICLGRKGCENKKFSDFLGVSALCEYVPHQRPSEGVDWHVKSKLKAYDKMVTMRIIRTGQKSSNFIDYLVNRSPCEKALTLRSHVIILIIFTSKCVCI